MRPPVLGSWRKLCRGKGLALAVNGVRVELAEGRQHLVRVHASPSGFHLIATVLQAARAKHVPTLDVWLRNREVRLAGFRFDRKGVLIAEAWVPVAGLDAAEFQMYLRHVAEEADRFEYALTGEDRH